MSILDKLNEIFDSDETVKEDTCKFNQSQNFLDDEGQFENDIIVQNKL